MACLQGWPLADIWELRFGECSRPSLINSKEWLTGPRVFVQTRGFMLRPCSLSVCLEFWYILGKGCPCDQPSTETLNCESQRASLGRNITPMLLNFYCWGITCLWPPMGGGEQREPYTWIPPDSACVFSPMIWLYILTISLWWVLALKTTIGWGPRDLANPWVGCWSWGPPTQSLMEISNIFLSHYRHRLFWSFNSIDHCLEI